MPPPPPPSTGVLLSAAVRVFARAAQIQLEEAAAAAGHRAEWSAHSPDTTSASTPAPTSTPPRWQPAPPPRATPSQTRLRPASAPAHNVPSSAAEAEPVATTLNPERRPEETPQVTAAPVTNSAQLASRTAAAVEASRTAEAAAQVVEQLAEQPSPSAVSAALGASGSSASATPLASATTSTTIPTATSATTATRQPLPLAEPTPAAAPTPEAALPTPDAVDTLTDATPTLPQIDTDTDLPALRSSTVPSSRLGRLFHYGSLAASLSIGAATESIRRTARGSDSQGSVFMSDANVRRLVATLGRMRGAALKLGQFMSIQDNHMLPPEIERVLHQVQAHANYMPTWQMEKVLSTELGSDWADLFGAFDKTPVASASIGQVHRAVLADGTPVAVKIQFPGVASSIDSDIANLSILLRATAVLPKGLYLQNTIAVMKRELEDECDYVREGEAGEKFAEFLKDDPVFVVPRVMQRASTGKVLTTEWMGGRPLSKLKDIDQETRDFIGTHVLRLCLRELFDFRFMQTDPNWGNFLFDASDPAHLRIQLIDFGASRAYTKEFMDGWYRLLSAALRGDRAAMKHESEVLGYLTGSEEQVMLDAHLDSMALLASPFQHQGLYPFATQDITDKVRELIPVMLKHRLTPPPAPTYSLNRKLSGAFLMCSKLGANVDCKALWDEVVGRYVEGPEPEARDGVAP